MIIFFVHILIYLSIKWNSSLLLLFMEINCRYIILYHLLRINYLTYIQDILFMNDLALILSKWSLIIFNSFNIRLRPSTILSLIWFLNAYLFFLVILRRFRWKLIRFIININLSTISRLFIPRREFFNLIVHHLFLMVICYFDSSFLSFKHWVIRIVIHQSFFYLLLKIKIIIKN